MDRLQKFCANLTAKIMKKVKNLDVQMNLSLSSYWHSIERLFILTKINWLLISCYIIGCMASQLIAKNIV